MAALIFGLRSPFGRAHSEPFRPVYLSVEHDELVLKKEDGDKRRPGGTPHLAEINDRIVIRCLADLNQADIIHRTQATVIDLLPSGSISDEKVARKRAVSVRSLQRELQKC